MCSHIDHLVNSCQCDRIACATREVIDDINIGLAAACKEFPEKVCLFSQRLTIATCRAAVRLSPPNFVGVVYDSNKVPYSCNRNECANPASNGSGIKMSTGGAFLSAAVVALVAATML